MNHRGGWAWVTAAWMAMALAGAAREAAKPADKGDPKDDKAVAGAQARGGAGKDAKADEEATKYPDFATFDTDGDGGVSLNDFLNAHVPSGKPAGQIVHIPLQTQQKLRRDFREADLDRSNILTKSEWEKWTGREAEKAEKAAARAAEQQKKDEDEVGGMDRKHYDRMKRELLKQQYRTMMRGGG